MSGQVFCLLEEPGSWTLSKWWPEAAGVAMAVFATALAAPPASLPALTSAGLWSLTARSTLPVFIFTAAAVYVSARFTGRAPRDSSDTAMGLACAATWLAPLVLFFRQNSPWCAGLATVLGAAGARAVLLRGTAPGTSFFHCLCAAAALQLGALAMAIGDWRAAAIPLTLAAVLAAWMLTARGIWPARPLLGGRKLRILPAFCLAVAFSAGGLTPYLTRGEGRGGRSVWFRALFGAAGSEAEETVLPPPRRVEITGTRAVIMGDSYPAVIVWPDVEPFATLVPPPPASPHAVFFGGGPEAYGVPFSGYYSFRRATVRQPRSAHTMHGDPAETGFRTTDLSPLIMEAHQDFGTPVAMNCCREIRIIMRVNDPRPDSIRIGLELSDRGSPEQPPEWLGTQPLSETVTFPMPRSPHLARFDRAALRFHLGGRRDDRSARAAVRRLVFVR